MKGVDTMKLTLLGVMGSVPGGQSDLGKNTTSLLIESDSNRILIDAGTGIMNFFSDTLEKEHHIIFTHYHLDHVVGLPFIRQLYKPDHTFHMYGPQLQGHNSSTILPTFLREPFLPIDIRDMTSTISHKILVEDSSYSINNFEISTMMVDHPGKCMVYTICCNQKKITILTDFPNKTDNWEEVIEFSSNSDFLYIDGYLMEKETEFLSDYGHCTIEKAIELFKLSNSDKLILSHHKSDRLYKDIKHYESTDIIIAKENQVFHVNKK